MRAIKISNLINRTFAFYHRRLWRSGAILGAAAAAVVAKRTLEDEKSYANTRLQNWQAHRNGENNTVDRFWYSWLVLPLYCDDESRLKTIKLL